MTVGRTTFVKWFGIGLALRIVLSPLYGTQDIEWWKAWGSFSVNHSITEMYGAPDSRMLELYRLGRSRPEILAATQTVIPFQPYRYFRTEYRVTQPPLYIYSLYVSTRLYGAISPSLANSRLFNAFINLQPILASALLVLIIARFVSSQASPDIGRFVALGYWLNPVVILNAPVQGYQDPICALFATLAVVQLFRRKLDSAVVFLVLGLLTKPQGVLVAPVVLGAGLLQHSFWKNMRAWIAGAAAGLVVALPFILANRLLSVVQGVVAALGEYSNDISRQALNLWWPVQYLYNAVSAIRHGTGPASAVIGGRHCWWCDVPVSRLTAHLGFSVQPVGLALLAAFTMLNLYMVWRREQTDPFIVIQAAVLQVYAYFILRVGVQVNHYFLLVPLFTLINWRSRPLLRAYAAVCSIFVVQDLIFYGFGRDFNPGLKVLTWLRLGWTTNVLAGANVAMFVMLCFATYRNWWPVQGRISTLGTYTIDCPPASLTLRSFARVSSAWFQPKSSA